MGRYIARRLLVAIPTLLALSFSIFALVSLAPGDPAEEGARRIEGVAVTDEDIARFRKELNLDRPFLVQYASWVKDLATGDLGLSFSKRRPVTTVIRERLPATIELASAAFTLIVVVSIPLGITAALFYRRWPDHLLRVAALVFASMPGFFFAYLLIIYLVTHLKLLPVAGRQGFDSLIMPTITVAIGPTAVISRLLRSSLLEVFGEDYVRTARAKGVKNTMVVIRHSLRNAAIPLVTLLGGLVGGLLEGVVITEFIFSWPGLGQLTFEAISQRDYPMIQAVVLMAGAIYVLVNLIVDISYGVLDPRIRLEGSVGRVEANLLLAAPDQNLAAGTRRRLFRRLARDRAALVGLVIIVVIVIACLLAPWIASHDPNQTNLTTEGRFRSPSRGHPFGTDEVGRDVFSRILNGGRLSLGMALSATAGITVVGIVLGLAATFYGRLVETVIMRTVDVLLALPTLILALVVVGLLGQGLRNLIITIIFVQWPRYARLVRGMALKVRASEFVEAGRAAGASKTRLILRHILPNLIGPVVVFSTVDMGATLLAVSGLSFLGFGVAPPTAEWGAMLSDARYQIERAPLLLIFPGAAISLIVLAFNLAGDGLRDLLDPRTQALPPRRRGFLRKSPAKPAKAMKPVEATIRPAAATGPR